MWQIPLHTGNANHAPKKPAKKCDLSIFRKAKINCNHCQLTFHTKCVNLPNSLSNSTITNWRCQDCNHEIFPFSSINNKIISDLSNQKLSKYSLDNIVTEGYSNICNVCNKKLRKNNKGVPCSNCKCDIHIKCAKIKSPKQTFHLYKLNWKCDTCLAELPIPFTFTDYNTLLDQTYNSAHSPMIKKFHPEVIIEDKLKLMLSYSKQSPWYAYTHPYEKDYDFFEDD